MPFTKEMIQEDANEAGVHWSDIVIALQTWAVMNHGVISDLTVAEAAKTFNTSPAVIREAIDEHAAWMMYSGPDDMPSRQVIDLDGE